MSIGIAIGLQLGRNTKVAPPPNLLRYSEQFDNAAWAKSAATISPDVAAGPDGATTADKLVETAVSAQHTLSQTVATTPGATYNASLYLKAAERTVARLVLLNGDGSNVVFQALDLATGLAFGGVGGTGSATIAAAGGGWYRLAVAGVAAQASAILRVFPLVAGSSSYAGDGASGLLVWGAQLTAGATLHPYRATT